MVRPNGYTFLVNRVFPVVEGPFIHMIDKDKDIFIFKETR